MFDASVFRASVDHQTLQAGFDVFNALSLMDNNLFLHEQLVSLAVAEVAPDADLRCVP